MILKIICKIIITILSILINNIGYLNPSINFISYINPFLSIIRDTLQTSINFVYFLIGDSMYAFLNFAIALLIYRYLVFPIVVIIRRVFIKGGDN